MGWSTRQDTGSGLSFDNVSLLAVHSQNIHPSTESELLRVVCSQDEIYT